MREEETCLFHATPVENVESIKRSGLLPGEKTSKSNASWTDGRAVYLGKRDGLNYPSDLLKKRTALFKVCIPADDDTTILADGDWVRNEKVDKPDEDDPSYIPEDEWESMSIVEQDLFTNDWRASIEAGFGARYLGSVPAGWIKDCEIGHFESKKGHDVFVKDSRCPGF
jgi:hypothetical protein